jgi:type IV secretion system protein TrbL
MKKLVLGAVLAASLSAFAAFTPTMTADQVTAEVNSRLAAGQVFNAMTAAGVDPGAISNPTAAGGAQGGGQTAGNAAGGDSSAPGNSGGGSTGSFGSSRSSSVGGGAGSGSGAASPN